MFVLKSNAKLNLALKVLNKRPDGYHNVFSFNALVGMHDLIKIKENKTYSYSLFMGGKYGSKFDNMDEAEIEENLITRAFNIMHKKYRIPVYFDVYVEKQIPIFSGLGGGSSNAATILNFCNEYFDIGIGHQKMTEIAASIGADVPFLLGCNSATCEGFGDLVTKVGYEEQESLPALIIMPNFSLKTPEVYSMFKVQKEHTSKDVAKWKNDILSKKSFKEAVMYAVQMGNDLMEPAGKIRSEMQTLLATIGNMPELLASGMSGSGAACFGICNSDEDLFVAMSKIAARFEAFDVFPTTICSKIEDMFPINTSRPSMETIFHNPDHDDGWKTIL